MKSRISPNRRQHRMFTTAFSTSMSLQCLIKKNWKKLSWNIFVCTGCSKNLYQYAIYQLGPFFQMISIWIVCEATILKKLWFMCHAFIFRYTEIAFTLTEKAFGMLQYAWTRSSTIIQDTSELDVHCLERSGLRTLANEVKNSATQEFDFVLFVTIN